MGKENEQGMSDYILELKDVVKTFGGVKALNGVQFQLKKGEIHALMGENGAGKSTFIKVITGVLANTSTTEHGMMSTAVGQAAELSRRENRTVFIEELFRD